MKLPATGKAPDRARERKKLGPSRISPAYAALLRLFGGPYVRFALHLRSIEFRNPEILVQAWRDFQESRSRLVIAFRHAYGDEPQILSYAFDAVLGREAKSLGAALPRLPRARFVHGYEVPLWCDATTRWILPRSGAMPVYHAKMHRPSMARVSSALRDGPYPLALAPEGQISYRSEALPRIEEGAARIGVWCARDLAAAGRSERVIVLPLSVHYRFDPAGMPKLERLVASIEAACGSVAPDRDLAFRIAAAEGKLIGIAEGYYGLKPEPAASRDERLDALLEEALRRAEASLGLERSGDRIQRVYRIRQEGWDRIYPEDGLGSLPPLERRLADRRAGEAWYAMRHMEFVDLCHYLDSGYLAYRENGEPRFDRLVEAAYSLADMAYRLIGGNISQRPSLLAKTAVLSASPEIDVSAILAGCSGDAKAATREASVELEGAFRREIREYLGRGGDQPLA